MNIGDKIRISSRLRRCSEYHTINNVVNVYAAYLSWVTTKIESRDAIFLGYRTLSNGRVKRNDDCTIYEPIKYIKAALVKTFDNTNPFFVRSEDIEVK